MWILNQLGDLTATLLKIKKKKLATKKRKLSSIAFLIDLIFLKGRCFA